ncbi:MAG: hypothetical protein JO316_06480 [Abitibacteriaceae bacterium]|nr:hypothetical protein [Abditibacteriaceae bacterium]
MTNHNNVTGWMKLLGFAWCWLAIAVMQLNAQGAEQFSPPKNLGDPAKLGLGVQRTMTLLATSTPQHHNTVRILFYGQSITEQAWWHQVADDLKRRFPNANLIIENRALGGFSSQLLVKTAETDLYSFYPDLMIFHVYGSHTDYEDIIRRARERTTTEVLIQTDHVTKDEDLNEETDPAKLHPDGKIWNSFMNYLWLPTVAQKYGAGILDQRNLWKQYLRDYNVHASQLLQDGVHPNAYGSYLIAQFTNAYLVKRNDAAIDPVNCDTVHTLAVGKDVKWQDGKLSLPFDGNRADIIAKEGAAAPATIRIDGQQPSGIPELYGFARALATPGGKWPVILKMSWEKPLQLEDWTMHVTKDPATEKLFTFTVSGSKTGPDGAGRSDQRFVSNSGRIVIDPADWDVEYALALPGIKPVPAQFDVHWKVVPYFVDQFVAPANQDKTIDNIVTIAQGLPIGHHTLEISGTPNTPIAAIRIYKPPVQTGRDAPRSASAAATVGATATADIVAAATSNNPAKNVTAIRILPLGDSITQGGRADRPTELTYRYPLYYKLKDAGYNVDFIGSMNKGLAGDFVWPARNGVPFDLDHEGHYGWKTAQARDHLREWMQTYPAPPDIVLIHLGTNDQGEKDFGQAIIQPLKDMIGMLREKNPHVVVLVGHLNFNGGAALQIRPLVEQMAKDLSTVQSPVVTVHHYQGWHEKPDEAGSDTFDWAHPNPQGQQKMAEKWFAAMQPYLDRLKAERAAR